MKTTHQVRAALDEAAATAAARRAFQAAQTLPERLASRVADPELRRRLEAGLRPLVDAGRLPPAARPPAPALVAVTPSAELGYPMWRFRRRDLRRADELGHHDCRAALSPSAPAGEGRGGGDPG